MDPFDPHRPPRTVGEKIVYAIGGIAGMAALIGVAAMVTSMVIKKDTPAPDPSTSASPVALITTPPEASSQPSSMPTSPPSEKPFGVFDPSEFTVAYSTVPAKDANCGLAEGPLIVPQELPKPSWDRVQPTLLLPSNPETGPAKTTGNVRHCYAKTGPGLIYAAANHASQDLVFKEFQSDEAQAITVLESFRKSMHESGAKKNDAGSQQGTPPLEELKPIGWDILTIDAEKATAQVLIYTKATFSDGREGYSKTLIPLQWDQGDWRIAGHIRDDPVLGDFTGMRKFD